MKYEDILKIGANVSIMVNANDLKQFFQEIATTLAPKQEEEEVYMTANQVCKYIGKVRSTLWTYEKRGYLMPLRVGNSLRYKKSEIDKLMNGDNK